MSPARMLKLDRALLPAEVLARVLMDGIPYAHYDPSKMCRRIKLFCHRLISKIGFVNVAHGVSMCLIVNACLR